MSTILGISRAKLILFGEHAVAYRQLACGIALEKRVLVALRPGAGKVRTRLAPSITKIRLRLRGATRPEALVEAALGPIFRRFDTAITLEVPPGAGFGTSAALAIALIRARDQIEGKTTLASELLEEAVRVETLAHGASSGLDPSLCLSEGAIRFRRADGARRIERLDPKPLWLVIGASGAHGGTKAQVGRIAARMAAQPALTTAAVGALGAAGEIAAAALESGDRAALGAAADLAHGVLSGLGLVGDRIESLVRIARKAGALGAKMSGAGGEGGAFVAFAADARGAEKIRRAVSRAGALAWVQAIGHPS